MEKELSLIILTLMRFTGYSICPLRTISLHITFGEESCIKTLIARFMVVDVPLVYNAIIYCPTLNQLRAMVSTYHRAMKFPIRASVGEVRNDPQESRQCYLMVVLLLKKANPELPCTDPWDPTKALPHLEPTKQLVKVPLDKAQPNWVVKIGATLPEKDLVQLINFLGKNANIFA